MIGNRRFLHRNPEIGDDLPITAKFVSEKLTEYGIPNKEICKCGIVGIIGGKKPGKTVMLRTDMDALPIKENSGLPFPQITGTVIVAGTTSIRLCSLKRRKFSRAARMSFAEP